MNDTSGKPPIRKRDRGLSRERRVEPARTALLVIDVQNGTFNEASGPFVRSFTAMPATWSSPISRKSSPHAGQAASR